MVNAFRWMIFVIGLTVVIGSIMVTSAGDLVILSINSPSEGEEVYSKMITVFGTAAATEGRYIVSVTVNNSLAGKETWSDDISLYEGRNTIKIVATDNFGNTKTKIRTVDYIAPTHSPTSPSMSPTTSPTQPPRDHEAPSATPTPTPAPTVSISITSIPSGANVWLDDSFKGTTPIRENVTVGYHEIKVIKEGYDIYSETKKIRLGDGEPQEMIIELKPLKGSIAVFSTPSGASVHLDNVDKGDTNCMLSEVVVGQHTIKLTKSGYDDVIRNVSVCAGRTFHLHENLTESTRYGSIIISSDPPGAKVYLDGDYTGKTPANISKVALGNHTIKLTKLCYDDEIINVSVPVGETCPLRVNLTGYGSLRICSYPSRAEVYLDGNYTGETPLDIEEVVVGSYSYRLTKSYYDDVEDVIDVSAGNLTKVHKSLSLKWLLPLVVGIVGTSALTFAFLVLYKHFFPKEAVPQSKFGRKRGVNRALNPKRSEIFSAKSNCGTASKLSNILRRSKKKDFLFSLDPSNREHLEEGDVNDELKKVFEKEKQSLPPGAKVSIIDEKHWEIVNGETQYSVEDSGEQLDIYKKRSR